MIWYLRAIAEYANFLGRARRREYWMFALFNWVFLIVAAILDLLFGLNFQGQPYGVIYLVYGVIMLLPGLSVTVRRLHDIGKNGWWVLISLIPFVGAIWLLILLFNNGNAGDNEYGPDPKGGIPDEDRDEVVSSDLILMIIVVWYLVNDFVSFLLSGGLYFFSDVEDQHAAMEMFFNSLPYQYFILLQYFVGMVIPFALAFVVKDSRIKTAVIIVAIIGALVSSYRFYNLLTFMF
jgi:uncharacterized membrane protein YhaH (DUF805 family)